MRAPRLYLWVVRYALEDTIGFAALADSARAAGCTDLILQVRGRGEAYYRSGSEPAPRRLEVLSFDSLKAGDLPSERSLRYDPLAVAIRIARARRLRVHAWINIFLAADWGEERRAHVVSRNPDWRIRLKDGRLPEELPAAERRRLGIEGTYLSPGHPRVLPYLRGLVRELAWRYPLDGIHLDYIRYPYPDAGYDQGSLDAYGASRSDPSAAVGDPGAEADAWDRWRVERISETVRVLAAAARSAAPGIEITAAVLPDPTEAYVRCKQDWPRWIDEGWCDRVLQMAYSGSRDRIELWRRTASSQDPGGTRIVLGLGLHKIEPATLERVLIDLREQGVGALAVFSDVELGGSPEFRSILRRRWSGSSAR